MRLPGRRGTAGPEEAPVPAAGDGGGSGHRRTLRATRTAPGEASPTVEHPEAPSADEGTHSVPSSEEPKSRTGRIRALLDEQVSESRDDAQRKAAMELGQFMEPARQQLLLNVPGSSSPEEAEAMLTSQADIVLHAPVEVRPDDVVDLRNPSSMRAYPPAEKLSNRVLRLADRHWAKDKRRSSDQIMAEKSRIADAEFARRPAGTQRCMALRGSLRCRGVFVYHTEELADGSLIACPTCGSAHWWDSEEETWVLGPDVALDAGTKRNALSS